MFAFQQQFKVLDKVTVPDPLGLNTQWTILRAGIVEDESMQSVAAQRLAPVLKYALTYTAMPRVMRKEMGEKGVASLFEKAADSIKLDDFLDSTEALEDAVRRVELIDPLEMVDDVTGERKRVACTPERIRELLSAKDPVQRTLVESILPIREDDLPEDPEERAEAEQVARAMITATSTLGRLLCAWVRRVSSETERYRESVAEEAEGKSEPGTTG